MRCFKMKELDPHIPQPEKTEIHAVKPVKDSNVLVERLKPKPGQKIWERNKKTGIIREAEFKEEKAVVVPEKHLITKQVIGTTTKIFRDVDRKDDCDYCCAISPAAADKKFAKIIGIKYPKGAKPKRNE